MKKLLFTLAAAATFAAMAGDPNKRDPGDIDLIGFDNFDFTQNVSSNVVGHNDYGTGSFNESQWVSTTGEDDSVVKPHPSGIESVLTNVPAPFVVNDNVNYLALDTNGGELQRYFSTDTTNGTATAVAATGTYIDTLVQFTVTEDDEPTVDGTTKLAIWLGVDTDGVSTTTNLYVKGGYYDESGQVLSATPQTYKLNKSCDPGTWYRLTVKAYRTIGNAAATDGETILPAFTILIDGEEVAATTAVCSNNALYYLCPGEGEGSEDDNYLDAATLTLFKAGKIIPSLDATFAPGTLFCVGFQGTGAIDDLVVTEIDPSPTPSVVDFTLTLTLDSNVTGADVTTNGVAVVFDNGTAQILQGTEVSIAQPTFTSGYQLDGFTTNTVAVASPTFPFAFTMTEAMTVEITAAEIPASYPTYIDTADATIKAKYDAWKAGVGCDDATASQYQNQFLLNVDESTTVGDAALEITEIKQNATAGWDITIGCTVSGASLTGKVGETIVCNGYLAVSYTDNLTGIWTTENIAITAVDATAGTVTVNVNKANAKFMKVTLTAAPATQE